MPPNLQTHLSKLSKVKNYLSQHWKELTVSAVFAGAAVLMIYALILQQIYYDRAGQATKVVSHLADETTKPSPLTGLLVPIDLADNRVLGVMIENLDPDARPQSGLSQAGVVFEALAEGGITRYLALFLETRPSVLGPVRSLRPYYLDWAMGFDAAIAHAGGSADALNLVAERHAKTLNGLIFSDGYWRASDRLAPHNLYTSGDQLDIVSNNLGYADGNNFTSLPRVKKEKPGAPTNTNITISFSGPDYETQWQYTADGNRYLRFLADAPDTDRENGEQLSAKNVVVLFMQTSYSDGQHADMATIGSGDAVVFRDGVAIKATWSKDAPESQIKLHDEVGKDVLLNPGLTWFSVVPIGQPVSY